MPPKMISKSVTKASQSPPEEIMLLRSGTSCNFGPWRDVTKNDARGLYGYVANVMHTDIIYEVLAIVAEDYGEAEANGTLPQAAIQRLREAAILACNKDVKKLKNIRPMFYAFLIKRIYTESLHLMQAHADFALAYVECDPNVLCAIILHLHLTHVGGHGPELALVTLDDELSKYESIRQGSRESIGDFLNRFKHGNSTLTSAGVEPRIDAVVAVQFLKKLESMVTCLQK
jgi:hypothetical protein